MEGRSSRIGPEELLNLLPKGSLIWISAPDTFSNSALLSQLSSAVLGGGGAVAYVDLDTTFSAYLSSGLMNVKRPEGLKVLRPQANNLREVMVDVLSSEHDNYELIILDSLTALYHLCSNGRELRRTPLLMGSYIALFKSMCMRQNSRLIVTSMLSSRRAPEQDGGRWIDAPTGKRFMTKISDVTLEITSDLSEIEVKVADHPKPDKKDLVYKLPLS